MRLVTTALAIGALLTSACSKPPPPAALPLSIGIGAESLGLLVVVADRDGLFKAEGLDVTLRKYPSGKVALRGMLAGEVEVAACAVAPIVVAVSSGEALQVLGTIGTTDNEPRIVARRDTGVERPGDLKGKRIGTQRGSAVHFFLSLYLDDNGISPDSVDIVFMQAKDLVSALADGEIDAFSMREPFISEAAAVLGEQAVTFEAEGLFRKSFSIVTAESGAPREEAMVRFFRALCRAEEITNEPDTAAAKLEVFMGLAAADATALAEEIDLHVEAGQFLLVALEDQTRWAINNKIVPDGTVMPDYLQILNIAPLLQAEPGRVTVIR